MNNMKGLVEILILKMLLKKFRIGKKKYDNKPVELSTGFILSKFIAARLFYFNKIIQKLLY